MNLTHQPPETLVMNVFLTQRFVCHNTGIDGVDQIHQQPQHQNTECCLASMCLTDASKDTANVCQLVCTPRLRRAKSAHENEPALQDGCLAIIATKEHIFHKFAQHLQLTY